MENLKSEAKEVLASLGTHPRRRLGQHFMVSVKALDDIVSELNPAKEDILLEIGPGLGFLTRRLGEKAGRVVAVEKDKRFCAYLRGRFQSWSHVTIVESDILHFPLGSFFGGRKVKCVGNIPYQISSPLLEVLQEGHEILGDVVLTFQKEFARRLGAEPGSRDRSALSSWIELHASVEILREFKRFVFYPSPRVDSLLVRLRFHPAPRYPAEDGDAIRRSIRAAFQKRRKNILNALAGPPLGLSKKEVGEALKEAEINPAHRAEDLISDDWKRLGRSMRLRMKGVECTHAEGL